MGGYISVPPIMCAWLLRRRTVIFNADSVLGNANILLSRFSSKIALAFAGTKGMEDEKKAVVVGLPLREDVIKASSKRYSVRGSIFITSGSQGTMRSDEIIPKAFSLLPSVLLKRIKIYQQVMEQNLSRVREYYKKLEIDATCSPFFANGSELLAACSLFIGRGGASTVAEVGTVGRPCILIPLEHKDRQQILNAEKITSAGGGVLLCQSELSGERLAAVLSRLLKDTKLLEKMAKDARIFPTNNNAGANIARLALE
jgi:UDP-N-acetylglucosamine--N-acetylmuramyl-(pentapeptide) pyrophosphoryl-undecaprenol N-acetylglucosamine transferase